ncbi:MAG: hypothetical protein ACYC7D_06795 [Nitrososphaerales archaeon]
MSTFISGAKASITCSLLAALLMMVATVTVLPVNAARVETGSSQLTVTSQNTAGGTITGYTIVIYDDSGNVVASGFTPDTFSTTAGKTYSLEAESYGSCTFSQWANGATSDPVLFTATNDASSLAAVYYCGASTSSTLKVSTVNSVGGQTSGYYITLWQNGAKIESCFSTCSFSVNGGQTYQVAAASFGSEVFNHWLNDNSTGMETVNVPRASTSIGLTAVYGGPSSPITSTGSAGITVYASRISAYYWAPCFAITCSAGTGPGASMYFILYDSSMNVVQTAFTNENGYTFTGLTAGATYYVYPSDCDLCHGSTHNVVFQYWGDNSSSVRPLAATTGESLDAWYSCTNGCGGY